MLPECRHVLHQMKLLRLQYELDGYHNVWIFKPGAKSRGRGIAIITLHHLLLFFHLVFILLFLALHKLKFVFVQ